MIQKLNDRRLENKHIPAMDDLHTPLCKPIQISWRTFEEKIGIELPDED